MKAIAVVAGKTDVHIVDRPEPVITAPDEIKVRIVRVGICGTDREEITGWAVAPAGQGDLVMGHENFGQVVAVGSAVTRLQVGDYCVFTVRRGCGRCLPCNMNRSDMCTTGDYVERGIMRADGFQAEYVVDKEQYAVRVPSEMESLGVLAEPLSVAEKAIDVVLHVQAARLPDAQATPDWLFDRRCLISGLGPIGLLTALALRLRGAQVYGLDVVDKDTARPQWLEHIGGRYIDGRVTPADQIAGKIGPMDLIFEASGAPGAAFRAMQALAYSGACVLIGVPHGSRPLPLAEADIIHGLVMGNRLMIGSVNAARDHFQMAVDDLAQAGRIWGEHVNKLITHHYPYTGFATALAEHPADEIKAVIEWAPVM